MRHQHKKKKKTKIPKKKVIIENPIISEVKNIQDKIVEGEKEIYELNSKKTDILETLVDKLLLNNDFKTLIYNYLDIDNTIKDKKEKQEHRKTDYEYKYNKMMNLPENEKNIEITKSMFKTASDAEPGVKMGLYNRPCKSPVAFCTSKQVFLSYKDIRNKRCLNHDNKLCKHLIWLNSDGIY